MKILVHAANITKFQNLLKAYGMSHLNHNTFIYVWRPEHLYGYRGNVLITHSDYFIHNNSYEIMAVAASRGLRIIEGQDEIVKFMTGIGNLTTVKEINNQPCCNTDSAFCHFLELDHDVNDKEQMHTSYAKCKLFNEDLQYDLVSGYRCDDCIEKFG